MKPKFDKIRNPLVTEGFLHVLWFSFLHWILHSKFRFDLETVVKKGHLVEHHCLTSLFIAIIVNIIITWIKVY